MITNNLTKLTILLVLFFIAFMFGCTERATNNSGRYPIKIEMDPGFGTGALAEIVNLVCLTVSARDMQPMTSCQAYIGGPITFDIDVPAGQDRLFTLQGINQMEGGQTVLYQGSTVADIEADVAVELSIHVEPIVPLIRFTPFQTIVVSGGSFHVNVEAFNLPNLKTTELRFLYDLTLLSVDSITKGATLGLSDWIEIQVGSNVPGFQVMIGDSDSAGAIVDTSGYSHLATLWFTSGVTVDSVMTALETVPLLFETNDVSVIILGEVFSQTAGVIINSYPGAAVRLAPAVIEAASGYEFYLDVELFNFPNIWQAEVNLSFNSELLYIDSVTRGSTLDGNDALTVILGDVAVPYIRATDTLAGGSIVDGEGYSHMARLWFSSVVTDIAAQGIVLTPANYFSLVGGGTIAGGEVPSIMAIVNITPFQDRVVSFPDPNLDQAVRNAILDYTSDPIYLSRVWYLTYLGAGEGGIQSLSGIEELVNLEYLELSYNSISDISLLANLTTLRTLYMDGNTTLSNIAPLSSLVNIVSLHLEYNSIADVSPLLLNTGLGAGDYLFIRSNPLDPIETQCYNLQLLSNRGVIVTSDCQ